jgi:hypothetical protein
MLIDLLTPARRRIGASAGGMLLLALAALSPAAPLAAQVAVDDTVARIDLGDVSVRGDHVIDANESAGDVVVYGGNLRILGRVTGEAAVFGGNLVLGPDAEILGDVIVAGGELINEGGRVRGEMRVFDDARALARDGDVAAPAAAGRAGITDEVREAVREARGEQRRASRQTSWFDPIKRGVAGIISLLALALVLGLAGIALVFYGRPHLETVSDTVRASPLRAGAVGLAAGFLAIPGFIVLTVVLAVSVIGIPLLLALPLYPVAFVVAAVFGFLGVSHAIGERTAEQRSDAFDLRHRNSYTYTFTGIAMFFAPLLAAELVGMSGFLGFVAILIRFAMAITIGAATFVGLGAVILSRAGTRRTFATPLVPPGLDADPLFDQEPSMRGTDA